MKPEKTSKNSEKTSKNSKKPQNSAKSQSPKSSKISKKSKKPEKPNFEYEYRFKFTINPREPLNTIFTCIFLLLWIVAAYYAVQFILVRIFNWLISIFNITSNFTLVQTIYSILSSILSLIVIILIPYKLSRRWKTSLEDLGIIEFPTWTDIGLAPIGFIVYTICSSLLTALFTNFSWFNPTETQDVGYNSAMFGADRLLALTSLVIVTPVVEELIFRGYLYGKLKKHLAFIFNHSSKKHRKKRNEKSREILVIAIAILLTSLLFAILHGQWNVGIDVFVMSIVLCLLREITGTIYAGIIMHAIKNALAFYLLYVVNFG